jgi:DNA-binding response OmpR family regulator
MLPDIDGYEVCRTLRTNTRTSHIPVIFLTQKDERSDKLQGLELGADDYITKPFDIEELKLRVQGAIRRSERESLTDPRSGLPSRPPDRRTAAQDHPGKRLGLDRYTCQPL